jgi:glycerophosphoryl diester phosphodiesterase
MPTLTSCQENPQFNKNKVIAHRGAWKKANHPQNSIASLQEAVRLGCEGSEFDVWMTGDGILVANHDADFLGIPIETSTYKELLQKKLPNGENIPKVEDYIKEGLKQSSTKLVLEIKTSGVSKERSLELAEKSVQLVKQLGAEKWVDYIAFDYDICLKVMETDPEANVAYLNGDKTPKELKDADFYGLDYNINVMRKNPQWIKEAHDLGLTVNVWTVNQEEDMRWLLDEEVEFISTDQPELLLEIIKK